MSRSEESSILTGIAMADDIHIDEERQYQSRYQRGQKPILVRLVLSLGIVSSDKAAGYVLFGVAAGLVVLTFFVSSVMGGDGLKQTISNQQLQQIRTSMYGK